MIDHELLLLLQELNLAVPKKVAQLYAGTINSCHMGAGFVFDQLRDYVPGDDIRALDWPGFARTQKLFVRTYHEEKSAEVTIAVDGGGSLFYGSTKLLKFDHVLRTALLIALAAEKAEQRYRLILYKNKHSEITLFNRGRAHLLALARILKQHAQNYTYEQTSSQEFLEFVRRNSPRPQLLFVISDFLTGFTLSTCRHLASRHDMRCIQIMDRYEIAAPRVHVHMQSKLTALNYQAPQIKKIVDKIIQQSEDQKRILDSCKVAHITISTTDNHKKIVEFLQQPSRRYG